MHDFHVCYHRGAGGGESRYGFEKAVDRVSQGIRIIERQRTENPGQYPARGHNKYRLPDKNSLDLDSAKYVKAETDYQCYPYRQQKSGYDLRIVIYKSPGQRGGHGESDNDKKYTGQPRYGFPVHKLIV